VSKTWIVPASEDKRSASCKWDPSIYRRRRWDRKTFITNIWEGLWIL